MAIQRPSSRSKQESCLELSRSDAILLLRNLVQRVEADRHAFKCFTTLELKSIEYALAQLEDKKDKTRYPPPQQAEPFVPDEDFDDDIAF